MKAKATSKYKYKTGTKDLQTKSLDKFATGVTDLNPPPPDYTNLYNAQNRGYNRRSNEQGFNSLAGQVSNYAIGSMEDGPKKTIFNAVDKGTNIIGGALDSKAVLVNGEERGGLRAAGDAIKYGGKGAAIGNKVGSLLGKKGEIIGTAVGGAVGTVGGAINGAVMAGKINKDIRRGIKADNITNRFNRNINRVNGYDTQGDMNSDIARNSGFAANGKYKLKSNASEATPANNPDINSTGMGLQPYKKGTTKLSYHDTSHYKKKLDDIDNKLRSGDKVIKHLPNPNKYKLKGGTTKQLTPLSRLNK